MPIPTDVAPPSRQLLRDDVFERLQDAIVDGTLAPGEQLRDHDVAAWLGVSRTPVREALLRLQHAGLVATSPGRSTTVTTLDARATRDAHAVVAAMHGTAVREAAALLVTGDFDRMRQANQRFSAMLEAGDVEAALTADDELHGIPVAAAGNHAVASVLDQFSPLLRRVERLRFSALSGRASVALHERLIERLEARDPDGAAAVSFETWQTLEPLLQS